MIPFLVWPIVAGVTAIAAAVTGAAIASDDSTPSSSSSDRVAETKRRARQKLLADMANDAETTLQGVVSNAIDDLRELELELAPGSRTTVTDVNDLVHKFLVNNGLSADSARANGLSPEQWLERLQGALQHNSQSASGLMGAINPFWATNPLLAQTMLRVQATLQATGNFGSSTPSLWTEINAATQVKKRFQERQMEINALDELIQRWQD